MGRGDDGQQWSVHCLPSLLQRGRAFWGAEIWQSWDGMGLVVMLQRGRAFWGAEIQLNHPSPARNMSFNGAAPFGARRSLRGERGTGGAARFNGAAPFGARRFATLEEARAFAKASTGPRLLGRGDALDMQRMMEDQKLASTGPRLLGRGDSVARRRMMDHSDPASTGPRLLGRGDQRLGTLLEGVNSLQRGRAFWGAEMSDTHDFHGTHMGPLQRGRAFWGAEI